MTSITLVRHGQASIHSDNYDQLSALGKQQSRALGEYWAGRGQHWDQVVVGPLTRHRQTFDEFAAAYQAQQLPLPEYAVLDGMREHEAIKVVDHVLPDRGRRKQQPHTAEQKLAFFREFDRVMRDWVGQRLDLPGEWETWQQARGRSESALDQLAGAAKGNVIAFTSGGFLSMAVGSVLGLSDEKVYELSLEVTNSAWAQLRVTSAGLSLRHFNWHPHLSDPEWVTLV